jgi:hypothetical protein
VTPSSKANPPLFSIKINFSKIRLRTGCSNRQQFCSDRVHFCNGVWVRAEERARMDTNGPILWRIVCRVCRWSFFWRIIEKFIFIEKRGEPLNWGSQGITIYYIFFRENSLSSLSFHFFIYFLICGVLVSLQRQKFYFS